VVLRVHLLGGLALEIDGKPVDPPTSRRACAVLGWLALNRGPHPRVEVAGRFWPDAPDSNARGNLRLAIWAIRRALGPAAGASLVATREEVGLAVNGSVWVDLAEFRTLVAQGRYEDALGLCRGEPLAELDDEWVYDAREEHREQVVEAIGRLAAEAEARGDLPAAIAWSRRQAAIDPLGEETCRELMRRLAAAGDAGAALGAFERLRERLARELGIAPSPATRKLAYGLGEVAGEEPIAEAHPPAPRARHAERTAFAGRGHELDRLREEWERARAGERRVVVLAGEPGIGKSRLAAELAREVGAAGAPVLRGRNDEDAVVPFQPFVEALRSHVETTPLDVLSSAIGAGVADLARLLPELERRLPASERREGRPEAQRYLMFEAVGSLLGELSRSAPVLLVLEDLQWADRPTLLLLRHVARSPAPAAMLVVGTLRERDPGAAEDVADLLSDLRRGASVSRISLGGLAEDEVADLVASWAGLEPPQALIRALHEDTAGNPFFLEETLRHLHEAGVLRAEEGRWTSRIPLEHIGVPEGVKQVVARRIAALADPCRRLLDLGATIGRAFDLELLERISDTAADEIAEVLDEAVRARVLYEEPGRAGGRYAFSHALVRETLFEGLSRTRRVRLHRAIAEAMEDLYAEELPARLGELAYHVLRSARPRDAERAADYARGAGEHAMELLAYEEAAAQFRRALEALDLTAEPDPVVRWELLRALGDALTRSGEPVGAAEAFEHACAMARQVGRPDLLARAALGFAGTWALTRVGLDPRSVELLEEALAALGDSHPVWRARLLTRLSEELYYSDARDRRAELSAEALRLARHRDDPAALAAALGARHTAIWGREAPEKRLELAREMARLGEDAADREVAFQGAAWSFADLLELGHVDEADAALARATELAEVLRQPAYRWWAHMMQGTRAAMAGDAGEAEARIAEAGAWGRRAHIRTAEMYEEGQLHYLRLDQGRAEEVLTATRRLSREHPEVPSMRCMLAEACAETGREEEARQEVEAMRDASARLRMNASWSIGMYSLAMACGRLGDADLAARLYTELLPLERYCHVSFRAASATGSIARTLGVLAATVGRSEAAERHLRDAIERNERIGALYQLARARHDCALVLRERGEAEEAAGLLASAGSLAQSLGMQYPAPGAVPD
jgi:predicted ATPase